MNNKKQDCIIRKKYKNNWLFLFDGYKQIKEGKHSIFLTLSQLLKAHDLPKQTFYKCYGRYKLSENPKHLLS